MVKSNLQSLIVFFLFLFTLVKSDPTWIDYNHENDYVDYTYTDGEQKHAFALQFKEGKSIPYYMKVEVSSNDDNPAPLLCFSNNDQSCVEREQLVKNPVGKSVFMWLKREQFENDELYAAVECPEPNCKYIISFTGDQYAVFEPNFVYSYLVGANNKEMRFDVIGPQKNIYVTVTLEGSSKATLNVEHQYGQYSHRSVKGMTFYVEGDDEINASTLAEITIKNADVGEYLTLSVHLVNDTDSQKLGVGPNNFILPNGPEITGYLELGVLNEECFPLNLEDEKYKSMEKLYITGRIYTQNAWFFLEDENRDYLPETTVEVYNGQLSYVMKNNGKLNYLCFELPVEDSITQNLMLFSFSVSEPTKLNNLYNYYPPQLTGMIYRRIIPKGSIAFFSGTKNDVYAKKYDYNLYQLKGYSKLYIGECRTYPDCHYDQDALFNLIEPKNTNQMTIWTTTDDKSSAIGSIKYVMVVQCEDDDNQNNGYCEFETSIFSKEQAVDLVENEKFSRFAVEGEKGTFIADIQNGRKIQRITFDIMSFSGDINFDFSKAKTKLKVGDEEIDITYQKYFLSNKIHFYINLAQQSIDEIVIEYNAEINSFFTIQYNVNSFNLIQTEEIVPSGESYLVQIDPTSPTKGKSVLLQNFRYKNKNPYFANFFALNCEFDVKRGETGVNFYDGYAQEIITSSSEVYSSDSYNYNITITGADLSNYNHKMCMLYVIGFESEVDNSRDIIIGENINQQIIFEKGFKKVRFVYPHSDIKKNLAVYINVIDKAYYKINIIAGTINIKTATVTRTQIFYLRSSIISLHCEENKLCPIILQVEYEKEITKTNPMIEITLREVKNTPTYLQKGQAKRDFVCGDKYYYLYTDVGKNEVGEITINFLREFGNIWAKIVRKDQSYADDDANWRGIYRMPSQEWGDSLPFNEYTKKMYINVEDTQDCIEGCYLLISVQISQIGDYVDDSKFYPFSIITRINPNNRAYTDIPKVVIQVDEFIIGNVDVSQNERISEFYEIWLPHDAETVEFDWQSSVAGLYVNLGGNRPTTKNADFKLLPPGRDAMMTLSKKEILEKAKDKTIPIPYEDSLEDINLVIGIWTDKSDSINTELYSLRVHETDETSEDSIDIIEINTDQKILCRPKTLSDGIYRCLFMIIYDDDDVDLSTPIYAYGASTNHGALNYMYGDFIERSLFDEFKTSELRNVIPTYETATLNSRKDGIDYIYVSKLEEQKYLYISVITDKPEDLMIVTSMPVYNYFSYDLFEFNPNPNTEQLLSCPGNQLRLVFPGINSVMVNIITLNGHATVSWKNDPETQFNLRGTGDRISLSSGKGLDQLIIKKKIEPKVNEMEDPGFIFYISYHERDPMLNFDELNYGKSLEISYKDTDLPVVLYSKILNTYRDVNVAVTFRDNAIDEGGEFGYSPILISAQLVKEITIYKAKKDPDLIPSFEKSVVGHYDTALKTAQIYLSEDIIKNYDIKPEDNPTLYVRVEKDGEFNKDVFEKFNIEAQVSGVNDGVIPVEKIYHYGRVRNTFWDSTVYRLKADKNRPLMRLQIAFNSNNLNFVLSNSEEKKNCTFLMEEKARGKVYITLEKENNVEIYYLYIFKNSNTQYETYLNNYAFKYINAKTMEELFDFPIYESPDISYIEYDEEGQHVINCTFNKLDVELGAANITYFFKVVENKTHYYGEEINTIAVTESPYYTVYIRNPIPEDNGKITLSARGHLSNWVYLNVIAQVQKDNALEYISYNGIKTERPPPEEENDESNNSTIFIIGCCILLLIIISLVALVVVCQLRNKKLMDQVKHVSYRKDNNKESNADADLLLKKSSESSQ